MTTKEYNKYLKDLDDMNLVTNEIRFRDNEIQFRDNVIAKEREAHQRTRLEMAQKDNIIAEYERRYGVLKEN